MTAFASRRLTFRPLGMEDCTPRYMAWLEDPQVKRYLETRFATQTLQSVRDFVAAVNASDDEHLHGMFLRDGGAHIGNIKVGPVKRRHGLADISLLVGERACWGQGYATEAIVAASTHAFGALGVRKLSAGIYAPNTGSIRAFVKAGYREEARRPGHYLLDGAPCDILEFGCLPADLK
jgi:RimJ/RimL family protein N-acetyltransferase